MQPKKLKSIPGQLPQTKELMCTLIRNIDLPTIERFAAAFRDCATRGGAIYLAGNGGSASLASHLSADLAKIGLERGLPVTAFSIPGDSITLTALANDFGYANAFEKYLHNRLHQRDLLLAISTSGQSQNVLNALKLARRLGTPRLGLMGGKAEAMKKLCTDWIEVDSTVPYVVEAVHCCASQLIVNSLILQD